MAKHEITFTGMPNLPDVEELEVQDGKGNVVKLAAGKAFVTEDPDVAAVVADEAVRAGGRTNVKVKTTYENEEAPAASTKSSSSKSKE